MTTIVQLGLGLGLTLKSLSSNTTTHKFSLGSRLKKIFGLNKFWSKKILVNKNVGPKKYVGPTKDFLQKIFGPKNFCRKKMLVRRKLFGPKIFFGLKKNLVQNFFVQNNFIK